VNQSCALIYRKLALQESDQKKAQLLQLLADEADLFHRRFPDSAGNTAVENQQIA
jgi:hypothetical protein